MSCVKGCGQGFWAKWDSATPGTAGGALPDCSWERGRQRYHKSQGTALWQRHPDRNCGLSKMPCSQPLDTQKGGRLRNKHWHHIFSVMFPIGWSSLKAKWMLGVMSTRVLESLQYQYKLLMYILIFVLFNLENLRANQVSVRVNYFTSRGNKVGKTGMTCLKNS